MKNLVVAVLASVAFSSRLFGETSADVLVWDVNTKEDAASYDGATRNFDSIKFWAIDANGNETDLTSLTYEGPTFLLNKEAPLGENGSIASWGGISDGPFYTDLTAFDNTYRFMAELYLSGSTDPVDRMLQALTLKDFGNALMSGVTRDNLDYHPGSVVTYNMASTMVPEPTSGLLLLFGGALLALRRLRVA